MSDSFKTKVYGPYVSRSKARKALLGQKETADAYTYFSNIFKF
jgi:hypothetical protein